MRLEDYDTSQRLLAGVVSSERLTPDTTDEVREIVIDVDGVSTSRSGRASVCSRRGRRSSVRSTICASTVSPTCPSEESMAVCA